ncbi:MAG: hypothetical protein IPO32_03525 [Crocinitomicaceae bacterium]|nr:hypothetical protein [Crocinitomicaceae bacterium]
MDQFQIKENGFREIKKTMLLKVIPIAIIAAAVGIIISQFYLNSAQSELNILPYIIPIIAFALIIGINRALKLQEELFTSYRLILDTGEIIREQNNTPTIIISKNEVTEIIKNSNGSFTIKGNKAIDTIVVPAQIDNYEDLEKSLGEIRPITNIKREPFLQKFQILFSILTIALMAAVFILKNKIMVGLSGTILLSILIYSTFKIKRNKNVDDKTKKSAGSVVLVIVVIIAVMFFKLSA